MSGCRRARAVRAAAFVPKRKALVTGSDRLVTGSDRLVRLWEIDTGKPLAQADTRPCTECLSEIPREAHRCAFCTSVQGPLPATG